jgi:protocatechuate 3,4-dioxygenase beta subunit
MKNYILAGFTILLVILFVNTESIFSQEVIGTDLTLIPMKPTFNGGQPIVFTGKLTGQGGHAIANAEILIKSDGPCPDDEILIKSDGPCPDDGIIASGFTDKKGKYRIYSITKVWDASDNMIRVQAYFAGNEIYSETISERSQIIIVYPTSTTEKCVNE